MTKLNIIASVVAAFVIDVIIVDDLMYCWCCNGYVVVLGDVVDVAAVFVVGVLDVVVNVAVDVVVLVIVDECSC